MLNIDVKGEGYEYTALLHMDIFLFFNFFHLFLVTRRYFAVLSFSFSVCSGKPSWTVNCRKVFWGVGLTCVLQYYFFHGAEKEKVFNQFSASTMYLRVCLICQLYWTTILLCYTYLSLLHFHFWAWKVETCSYFSHVWFWAWQKWFWSPKIE